MASDKLRIHKKPKLSAPRILLGFSGWMDGGEVSTGTVKYLIEKLEAQRFADIEPEGFFKSGIREGTEKPWLARVGHKACNAANEIYHFDAELLA